MNKQQKRGFSLIELIVVITIIMVVTVVGTVSYVSANTSARDGRRKSDIEKIRIALELYKQQNGTYPAVSGTQANLPTTYLAVWPTDPKGYLYVYTRPSTYTYVLYSKMEGSGYTNTAVSCGTGIFCNYQVNNP